MKRILALAIIALAMTLPSCTATETDAQNSVGTTENTYKIEIENNKKWVVVEDMMLHIQTMNDDIESTGKAETSDFEGLGKSLQENIDLLTSNCTMTGKAHDELHKWLLPFIELVEDLNKASSFEEKQEVYQSLEQSMIEFNAYFE